MNYEVCLIKEKNKEILQKLNLKKYTALKSNKKINIKRRLKIEYRSA